MTNTLLFDSDQKSTERINWIDQVKGFTIFLVVYGHNFPCIEKYIYSFHMPLFIMIAGYFHPKTSSIENIKKRFIALILPYFLWSTLLFLFWFVLGRHYGDSVQFNLSPVKNFLGIFYAQGDRQYMDWGIPLWFLPALFLMYLLVVLQNKIKPNIGYFGLLFIFPILGLFYAKFDFTNLPWSFNIALVGTLFYNFGYIFLKKIKALNQTNSIILIIILFIINFLCYNQNTKIDMYRGIYGNEFYFVLNGISGSLFIILFFKVFPFFTFLEFIGKFSLTILALQLLALTFIKFILLKTTEQNSFEFNEYEKLGYSIVQILLLIPSFFIINKFLPILNGGYKKI
jgi:acyltransferase